MFGKFEKDGKEITEVLFGHGSVTVSGHIEVANGHISRLRITHIEPPQEIGEPVDFDKVDVKESITLPMITESLFHFERWLKELYLGNLEKHKYTFKFENGDVILNFERYNKKSINVVYKAVKRLYMITALMESDNVEEIFNIELEEK